MATNSRINSHKSKSGSRGRGLGTREARARVKAAESKSARDALLLERRRIPLSEIQEQPKKRDEGSELRLQRLREWKAKRAEAREKEKAAKKKPFYGGKLVVTTTAAVSKPRSGAANTAPGRAGKSSAAAVSSSAATDRATEKPGTTRKRPVGLETAAKPETSGSDTISGDQTESNDTALVTSEDTQPKTTAQKAKERKAKGGKKAATNAAKPPRPPPQISTASRASKRLASENQPANDAGASRKHDGSSVKSKAKLEPPKPSAGRGGKEVKTGEGEKVGRVTRSTTATASGRGGAAVREVGVKKTGKAGKKRVNTAESSGLATTGKKRVKCDSTPVHTKLSFSDSSSEFSSTSPPLPPSMNTTTSTVDPVPDCAWVAPRHVSNRPNPHLALSALQNIDDILGPCAFSPFKFTARQATPGNASQSKKRRETPGEKFAFSFRMTTDRNPFSLPAETTCSDRAAQSGDVTFDTLSVDSLDCNDAPKETVRRPRRVRCVHLKLLIPRQPERKRGTEQRGKEMAALGERRRAKRVWRRVSKRTVQNVGVGGGQRSLGVEAWCGGVVSSVCGKKEEEEEEGVQNGDPITSEGTAGGGTDFVYFHRLHDDVETHLATQCSVWKEKSESLEALIQEETQSQEDAAHLVEAVDGIRVTVGQAELLMRKKMKQYLGLVTGAEDMTDGGNTTAEDLQGFWDLVSIQVDDMNQKFKNLEELERNDWKQQHQVQPTMNKKRGGKKRPSKTGSSAKTGGELSERQAAARERRSAMRSRLKEMKMAAMANKTASSEEGEREEDDQTGAPTDGLVVTGAASDPPKQATPPPQESDTSCSSGKRKSTGGKRRRSRRCGQRSSFALIDFSEDPIPAEPQTPPSPPSPSVTNPSIFSPTDTSSDTKPSTEVPIADLLSFTAQQQQCVKLPSLKTPLNWPPKGNTPVINQHTTTAPQEGASVVQFVSVTPSKRVRYN
ncbi:Disks large-associated protein 5 [Geodia barretti]|uniref:Disks large-associated protein 5 n=1 Tax=Geodia barretti TaxID=519541 RepID=A0AA35WYQ8_GEOBA|nr:Disks large-associated protein 5 [Geodia barretti]